MKIYLLPYTFKTFLSKDKIHSGIDMSTLLLSKALKEMDHEIKLTVMGSDISNLDYLNILNPNLDSNNTRDYFTNNRKAIYETVIRDISNFSPDVIFSSYEICAFYKKMMDDLNIPIIYQCHETPGSFQYLTNGNMINDISINGTVLCVTNHHKNKFQQYFSAKRENWEFDSISVTDVLPSSYIEEDYFAQVTDGVVRHISAASSKKKTFLIHEYLNDSDIQSEVFTTMKHLHKMNDSEQRYIERNMSKFSNITFIDVNHSDIMDSLSKSLCSFVALGSDTYTITSLESLSRGVPLILGSNQTREHPALEMCCDKMKEKFVRVITNKNEFIDAIDYFKTLTLDDRKELVKLAKDFNSKSKFKAKVQSIIDNSVSKFIPKQPKINLGI